MDRSTPSRTSPRVPSPWWVLVPGVLLVLVGVRAVTAEADRAREEARERARNAAEHVARTLGTLLDEYVAPLPKTGSRIGLDEVHDVTRHLWNAFVTGVDGRGVVTGKLRELRPTRAVPPDVELRDAALAESVFARIEAGGEDGEELAALRLLSAAAEAVETQWVEGVLRLAAAHGELRRDNVREAHRQLEELFQLPPEIEVAEGSALGPPRPWLAACELALADDRLGVDPNFISLPIGPDDDTLPPTPWWWRDAHQVICVDPWGLQPSRRAELLERFVAPVVGTFGWQRLPHVAGVNDAARDAIDADRMGDVLWSGAATGAVMVQRKLVVSVEDRELDAWVGGSIPRDTLESRLSDAGTASGGVSTVVRPPDGAAAFGDEAIASGALVEEVMLSGRLVGWRVESRVDAPTGLPTSAWLLGGALAAASVLLALGAFALSRAAAHHARLAEERRNFLDHVAHEVRTPAAAMLALSEELERGHVDPERQSTYHEHLLRESQRLADLVEETLDLTRLESGRLVSKREPADLRDVVRAAIDAARVEPEMLTVALPGQAVRVDVDVAAVRRAVRNLVDNALKHGACDEPVGVRLSLADGRATLTVRDHGKGIPADHVERVFERFHRVPSATHEVKGVGLGLALVREVAEAHGGVVSAANADGGGARFTFTLPLEDRA